MSLNEQAKHFWENNKPYKRLKFVPGLHMLAYFVKYKDLTLEARKRVRDMITSLKE